MESMDTFYGKQGKFLHNVMGKYLIDKFRIVRFEVKDDQDQTKPNNLLYIYHNGAYITNDEIIQTEMINLVDGLTNKNRQEVLSYMKLKADIVAEDSNIIALKNGYLNEKTFEFYPLTEENKYKYRTTRKINHNYNENAKSELLDNTLNGIFLGDEKLKDLFYEMVGYCMHYTCEFEKVFIFVGEGANGKSTLFNLIYSLFGSNNYTANSLQELSTNKFRLAGLNNKMVNIDDDTKSSYIADSSILKKLVSGAVFEVEKKNINAFNFRNRAKLLFSCNNQTKIGDTSNGTSRRLIIVPLKADFRNSADETLGERLATEEVYETLLINSIKGLQRLMANRKFTTTQDIEDEITSYVYDNNPVLQFVDDQYGDENGVIHFEELDIEEKLCSTVYENYKIFCSKKGHKNPLSSNSLGLELKRLGFLRKRLGNNVASKRIPNYIHKRPYYYEYIKEDKKQEETKIENGNDYLAPSLQEKVKNGEQCEISDFDERFKDIKVNIIDE